MADHLQGDHLEDVEYTDGRQQGDHLEDVGYTGGRREGGRLEDVGYTGGHQQGDRLQGGHLGGVGYRDGRQQGGRLEGVGYRDGRQQAAAGGRLEGDHRQDAQWLGLLGHVLVLFLHQQRHLGLFRHCSQKNGTKIVNGRIFACVSSIRA